MKEDKPRDIRQFIVDELKEHGLEFKDDYLVRDDVLLAAIGLAGLRYQKAMLEELVCLQRETLLGLTRD